MLLLANALQPSTRFRLCRERGRRDGGRWQCAFDIIISMITGMCDVTKGRNLGKVSIITSS